MGLVKRLKGSLDTKHVFNVKIADGGRIATQGTLSQIPITIKGFKCVSDLYAIALGECDVVLGVQWLRTLGHILWDFNKLYMQFTRHSRTFCITSPEASKENLQDISALQMQKLLHQESTVGVVLFHIEIEEVGLFQLAAA